MKLIINDLQTQLFAQALLEPGEQLHGKLMGQLSPWYTRFLPFDFLKPYTLILATDRRLLLLEHKRGIFSFGYELASIESVPWSDVEELAAKGLFVKNKIKLRAATQRGPKRVTMNIQAFAGPLKKNGSELKSIVGTFQARRSAPPAALPGQAPGYGMQQMPQGYAAPQLPSSMAPAAPYAQQPQQVSGYPQPGYGAPPSGYNRPS